MVDKSLRYLGPTTIQLEEWFMAFHPYLYFGGNCREAFTRYQEIFGGELTVMEGTEAPPDAGIPAAWPLPSAGLVP